jgi:hypothetical protein
VDPQKWAFHRVGKIYQSAEKMEPDLPEVCAVIFQIVGNGCQLSGVEITIAM